MISRCARAPTWGLCTRRSGQRGGATVGVALHLGQGSCSLVPPSQVCSPLPAQPMRSPILSWRICARSSENGHQVAGGPQR